MKIKIKTPKMHFSMPIPAAMIRFAVKLIPDRVFQEACKNIPDPYSQLVTKASVKMILEECIDILKENKGLEAVHVEAADGTYVSIKL